MFSKERLSECLLLAPGQATLNMLYQNCFTNARNREIGFSLTKEKHAEIISKNCYYCGESPRKINYLVKKDGTPKKLDHNVTPAGVANSWTVANTVDRIDSKIGYSSDNCVAACWPCNEMKNDSKIDTFLLQVEKIHAFQQDKKK